MTVNLIFSLVSLAASLIFGWRRTLTYLHIFQQEEYDGGRFIRWIGRSRSFDRKLSLALLMAGVLELLPANPVGWLFPLIAASMFLAIAWREPNPLKAAKKKLQAELDRAVALDLPFTPLADGDVYASEGGPTLFTSSQTRSFWVRYSPMAWIHPPTTAWGPLSLFVGRW